MHEYYLGMKFARALVWSRGLRDRIGLGEEISDEELAQQNFVDPKAKVLTIWNWRQRLTRPESEHLEADLLILCETTHGNIAKCINFCIYHDIQLLPSRRRE